MTLYQKQIIMKKTFEEIAGKWMSDKKPYVKKSTYCAYSLLLSKHLVPAFGEMGEITESHVQNFVFEKLSQGLAQKYVKDMLIVLKMIIRYAVKNKYMHHVEMEIKFPPERTRRELDVLTRSQHRQILNYVKNHFSFMNLGIYICLCTGLRIGEICALQWDDIDTSRGILMVSRTIQRVYVNNDARHYTEVIIGTPKSRNSMREIPIARELLRTLKPLKRIIGGDCYVLTSTRKPIEPRTYRNYYNKLIRKLDIPPLKFHGLRHSFATRCIEGKCDYKTVSVLLGHSNISTTLNLYVHPNMEQKQKCVEQVFRSLK